jgi:hypothetical protein
VRELVVSGGDTPPVFEPAEHTLDQIAPFVDIWIEGMEALSRWIIWDNGLGAAFDEKAA